MLALLVPGLNMGGGAGGGPVVTFHDQVGVKHGLIRSDGPDIHGRSGLSGVSFLLGLRWLVRLG